MLHIFCDNLSVICSKWNKTMLKPSICLDRVSLCDRDSDHVYDVNYWTLNVHLQFSVVIPVIFAGEVYWRNISHDIVQLCLVKKKKMHKCNCKNNSLLSTHILGCLIWKRTYFNSNYNYSNYLLTPPALSSVSICWCLLFFTLYWLICHSYCYLRSFISAPNCFI